MSCEQFRELMSSYMDGYIEEDKKIEFENHLKYCKDCKEEFEQFKFIINEIKKLPDKKLPNHYHEDLMLRLYKSKEEDRLSRRNSYFNWKILVPLAASFIVLIFVIGNLDNILTTKDYYKQESATEEMMEDSIDIDMAGFNIEGEKLQITAEDGVNSKLNYSTDVDRKIIYDSNMYIEVEDFDKTINEIKNMANNSGGYVENSSSYIYDSDPERDIYLKQGTIVIRIPVESYGQIQEELISLGHLINQEENSTNVTEEYIETESRIRMLEIEQNRLLEIMEKSDKVEDLIKLEERLNQVRTDLEIYKSKIKNWDQLVSLSTFTIKLKEVKEKEDLKNLDPNLTTKIKFSFIKSVNDIRQVFEKIIIYAAYGVIPFIIFIIIIFIVFIITKPIIKLLLKKIKKRKDE
ncbi:DUF4349 domain-containing protein [Defluviitalea phaphyphila]|uniref:DUF4349 domain-containing protein n=1 Tax=Defluviitalea phaphyphila TaxID=1473580 RepID=UPI000730E619|nr:DUF4349 domain-containing protein [Defluviitalea phaphyphila]